VYARILGAQGLGYPLWFPEPSSEPPGHASKGISIGDIGFITFDGCFKVLFNIYLPRDDPGGINRDAPANFEPLVSERGREVRRCLCNPPGDSILSERIHITPNLTAEPEDNR
jgi:hypothetical protein